MEKYALGDKSQPMGIAEYKLVESLPPELQTSLPGIERELATHADDEAKRIDAMTYYAEKYFYKFCRFKSFLLSIVASSIPFSRPKIWGQDAGNIYR